MKVRMSSGQALLEYVLALAALLVVVSATGWLIAAAKAKAERTSALVRSEYP